MKAFKKTFLNNQATLYEALESIQTSKVGIALIVDNDDCLLGVVTDGNIRRAILNKKELSTPVDEIMEKSPVTLKKIDALPLKIQTIFQSTPYRQIPILDDEGRVVDLVLEHEIDLDAPKPNLAIIMAGGLGSRLKTLTTSTPKVLLPVGDRPILESIILRLKKFGIINIKISVNFCSNQIIDYFGNGEKLGVNITYIHETKKLGTAGALSLLEEIPPHPFLLMNGDLLTDLNFSSLIQFHYAEKNIATMCVTHYSHQVPYGIVQLDENHRFLAIDEKPKIQSFINAGIYVLNPESLTYLAKNEYLDITSLFQTLKEKQHTVSCFPLGEYWLDIGSPEEYSEAQLAPQRFLQ